jgi:hypothetical protein
VAGDEPRRGLPIFSKDGRNKPALVATLHYWLTSFGRAARSSDSTVHNIIVAAFGLAPLRCRTRRPCRRPGRQTPGRRGVLGEGASQEKRCCAV